MKRILLSLLTLALLGVLVACSGAEESAEVSETAAEETTSAQDQAAPQNVLAEGEVVPLTFIDMAFQTGGLVSEVLVTEGDQVSSGDVLARLDSSDVEIAVAQSEARLASAQSGVAAAESRLTSAEAQVNTAELQVSAAEAQLAVVVAGPRPEQIEAAEKQIEAADAAIAQAAGQRNASLNIATDAAVQSAEAQVAAAQAQFVVLQETYDSVLNACFTPEGSDTEICPAYGPIEEQVRAQLNAARANADAAQAGLDQLLSGATSGQRAAAGGGVVVAQAQKTLAEAQLELLLAGATPEQVRQAEVAVEQAKTRVEIANAGVVQAEAAVQQAMSGVITAEAALETVQATLAKMILTAPFDGTIGRVSIDEGQIAGPGAPAVSVADLSGWLIETTDLTELDVAKVEVGSTVEISFDAIPGETLTGEVAKIASVSGVSQGDVVYQVTIDLADTAGLPIRWGMTTFVDVDAN